MKNRIGALVVCSLTVALGMATAVRADGYYNTTTLRPASGGDGLIGTEGARPPNEGDATVDLKLFGIVDHNPLLIGTRGYGGDFIINRFRAAASLQVKLYDGASVGIQLPMVLNTFSELGGDLGATSVHSGFGDLRVSGRLGLLRQERVGLNAAVQFNLDTASGDGRTLASDRSPQFEGLLALSRVFGDVEANHIEVIGNALAGGRPQTYLDGMLLGGSFIGGRLGASYYVEDWGVGSLEKVGLRRVFAEVEGRTLTRDLFGLPGSPAEARAGVTFCIGPNIAVDFAGGGSLTYGNAIGAPDWHLVMSAGFSPATCHHHTLPPPGPTAEQLAAQAAAEREASEEAARRQQLADEEARAEAARAAQEAQARKMAEEQQARRDLEARLAEVQRRSDELGQQVDSGARENARLNQLLQESGGQLEELRQQKSAAEKSAAEAEGLQERTQESRQKAKARAKELASQLTASEEARRDLESRLAAAQKQADELGEQLTAAAAEKQELGRQLQESREQLEQLEQKLAAAEAAPAPSAPSPELEQQLAQSEAARKQLEARLADAEQRAEALGTQLSAAGAEKARLDQALEEARGQLARPQAPAPVEAAAAPDDGMAARAALEAQLAEHQAARSALEAQLKEHQAARTEMEDELAEQQAARKELEDQLAGHRAALASMETAVAGHRASRQALEGQLAEHQQARQELESQLAEHQSMRQALEAELAEHKAGRKELEDQLARETAAREALEQQLAAREAERKELEDKLAQASGADHSGALAEAEAGRRDAEARLAEAQGRAEKLRQLLEGTGADKARLDQLLRATSQQLDELVKQKAAADARAATYQALARRFRSMIDTGKLTVKMRKGRMIISMPNDVLFDSGKAELKKGARETLAAVAKALAELEGRQFLVAGHTDDRPIHNQRYPSNWELSTARAVRVTRELIGHGMKSEALGALGYGEYDPVASNDSKEHRAQNRRIEIQLQPNLSELPSLDQFSSQ